jgi:hypothetical protein
MHAVAGRKNNFRETYVFTKARQDRTGQRGALKQVSQIGRTQRVCRK